MNEPLVAFSRGDADRILELIDSTTPAPRRGVQPGPQLRFCWAKMLAALPGRTAGAAIPHATARLWGIDASDMPWDTGYNVEVYNLAFGSANAVANGKEIMVAREDMTNRWLCNWEAC